MKVSSKAPSICEVYHLNYVFFGHSCTDCQRVMPQLFKFFLLYPGIRWCLFYFLKIIFY